MKPVAEVLFKTDHGRYSIFRVVKSAIKTFSKRRLARIGSGHLKAGAKQIVIFSFDDMGININEDGIFERDELDTFFGWMASSEKEMATSSAIDAGANIGNHSLYFSQYFKKVYAFEPNPRTFKVLSMNSELADNIVCYDCGLSDKNEQTFLEVDNFHIGGAHIQEGGTTQISVRRLDDVIEPTVRVLLYKIDVEGHEYEALRGSEQTIRRNRPIILFEQLPQEISSGSSRTIDLLRSFGYSSFAVVERFPKIAGNLPKILRAAGEVAIRVARGSQTQLVTKCVFETRYYSLIVALPDLPKPT
jgi:FkbM family methyltransferase